MKHSTKGALLSAFLFPGAGHLYLKKYVTGGALIGVSLWAIYYLLARTIEMAMRVSEMIQRGQVGMDVLSITEALSKQATRADSQLLNIATAAIIGCFLIGIVDSYRIGRARDRADDQPVITQ